MLDDIRKKRLNLAQQLNLNRPRIKSSQKRKMIEANLQRFKKQVNQSNTSSSFRSANNFYSQQDNSYLNQSPTMKDLINPFKNTYSQLRHKTSLESPRFKQVQQKNQKKPQILENISNQNNSNQNILQQQPKIQQKVQISIDDRQNNEISNSSLFKQIQNLNNKDVETRERHVTFSEQITQIKQQKKPDNNQTEQKKRQNVYQLNFNYNQSGYGSSSNGSAILFTSQFRQYINKDKNIQIPQQKEQLKQIVQTSIQPITSQRIQPRKKTQSSEHNHTERQIAQSFLKLGEQELSSENESRKKLYHNQSGRSLAFSNINDESMLKQSKANEINAQEIVTKKIYQQLVLDMDHFRQNNIKDLFQKYAAIMMSLQYRNLCVQLKLLNKLAKLRNKSQQNYQSNLKRYCFDGFLMLKQLKFQDTKNQIKADNFLKDTKTRMMRQCYQAWKNINLQNQIKVIQHNRKAQEALKKNIFQIFRMIWFDSKVKHQIDMYYLSKIFNALRTVTSSQRKKSYTMALKQYCRSLKRFYFNKILQGVETMRKQRLNQQLADQHYRVTILKKYYDAWLQQCDRSPQYISLTMTSKNVFKQTLGNKWLGVKTVDFKQIKD